MSTGPDRSNNDGRTRRVTGVALYELPFGPGKTFLDNDVVLVLRSKQSRSADMASAPSRARSDGRPAAGRR
jgi:hypothetical protein